MFSFVLIASQLFLIIMLAIFYKSINFDIQNSSYITYGLTLILGFTFMYTPYRKLTLFSLILLLIVTFVSIQTYLLFGKFFDSCFVRFSTQTELDAKFMIRSIYGALGTIITCLDFIGLFQYWQVYVIISFIMTIGYSLISAIIIYGLDVYDGGGGVTVFLYTGIVSLVVWFVSVRGKIHILQHKKSQSYINYTFMFIGVVISFFSWPILNMGGALITFINTNLKSNYSLVNSSYINTLSGLGMGIISSMILSQSNGNKDDKMKPKIFIECFVNAGIIIASYNDLTLNPVCGMVLALVSSILTLLLDKYIFQKTDVRNQSDVKMIMFKYSRLLFRVIFSLIGICVAAIVISTRQSYTSVPLLIQGSYSSKAGLSIVGWILGLIIGVVFGGLIGIMINIYLKYRSSQKQKDQKMIKILDGLFFDQLQQDRYPIYMDFIDMSVDNAYEQDLTRRVLNQSLLKHKQIPVNIYETNKKMSNSQNQNQVQKETILIRNDFSRSNLQSSFKQINLSVMKYIQNQNQNQNQELGNENQKQKQKKYKKKVKYQKQKKYQKDTNYNNQDNYKDKNYSPIQNLNVNNNNVNNNFKNANNINENNRKDNLVTDNISNNFRRDKTRNTLNNNNINPIKTQRPVQFIATSPSQSKQSGLISPKVLTYNIDNENSEIQDQNKNIQRKLIYENQSIGIQQENVIENSLINQ